MDILLSNKSHWKSMHQRYITIAICLISIMLLYGCGDMLYQGSTEYGYSGPVLKNPDKPIKYNVNDEYLLGDKVSYRATINTNKKHWRDKVTKITLQGISSGWPSRVIYSDDGFGNKLSIPRYSNTRNESQVVGLEASFMIPENKELISRTSRITLKFEYELAITGNGGFYTVSDTYTTPPIHVKVSNDLSIIGERKEVANYRDSHNNRFWIVPFIAGPACFILFIVVRILAMFFIKNKGSTDATVITGVIMLLFLYVLTLFVGYYMFNIYNYLNLEAYNINQLTNKSLLFDLFLANFIWYPIAALLYIVLFFMWLFLEDVLRMQNIRRILNHRDAAIRIKGVHAIKAFMSNLSPDYDSSKINDLIELALKDDNAEIRRCVVEIIILFNEFCDDELFKQALRDPEKEIRRRLTDGIIEIKNKRGDELLKIAKNSFKAYDRDIWETAEIEECTRGLKSDDFKVAINALRSLCRLKTPNAARSIFLSAIDINSLINNPEYALNNAVEALKTMGDIAIDPALQAINHDNELVRAMSISVLGSIDPNRFITQIENALKDADSSVRLAASEALKST